MRSVVRCTAVAILVCLLVLTAHPAPAAAPAAALTVRVEGPDGKPVVGAKLVARGTTPKGRKGVPALGEAVTGDDGTARLGVPDPCPCTVRAEATGHAPALLAKAEPGSALTLRLGRGAVVEGRAFDVTTGKPLGGAEVLVRVAAGTAIEDPNDVDRFTPRMRTGEDGRFRLEGVTADDGTLVVRKDGFRVQPRAVALVEGANPLLSVYLAPGIPLSGKVVDPAGKPVARARVTATTRDLRVLIDAGDALVTSTRPDGTFTFRGLPPASAYVLRASHDDWASGTSAEIPAGAGRRPGQVTIALKRGAGLTATLRDGEHPFVGVVDVSLVYEGSGPLQARVEEREEEIKEGAGGLLQVDRLPEGAAKLTLEPAGFTALPARDVRLDAAAPADLGELALERGRTITGRITDAEGKPAAEVELDAFALGVGGASRVTARSAADGRFVLGGVTEGLEYRVTARAATGAFAARDGVKEGSTGVDLVLAPTMKLTGRAVTGDPPKPVSFVTVEASRVSEGGMGSLLSALTGGTRVTSRDAGGRFTLDGLAAGTYAVTVTSPGYVPVRLEKVEVKGAEPADLGEVRLSRGATLRVSVVDKTTQVPLGGAGVALGQGGMFGALRERMQREAAQITGPDGRVVLDGLPPGRATVKVRRDGYAESKAEVEIAPEATEADLTIALTTGGAVEGTVRDREGRLRPGAMVIVTSGMDASPDLMDAADEGGNYRIERVPPGSYMVVVAGQVSDQGRGRAASAAEAMAQMQMQTVVIEDGKSARLDFPAGSGKLTVKGVVKRGGKPIAARMFWVREMEGGGIPSDFVTVTAGTDGRYQVRLQAAGTYRVRVQDAADEITDPGFGVVVEVPEKPEVEQDVQEPAGAIAVDVSDLATARPVVGARVTALRLGEKDEVDARDPVGSAASSDEDGRVRVKGLAEGRYRVVVSAPGYGIKRLDPVESDGEDEETRRAALERAPALAVRVADENGTPVQGALVIHEDELYGAAFGRLEGLTDATGGASLRTCGQGTHTLLAIAPGFAPRRVTDVVVGREAPGPLAIKLERGGGLKLKVTDNADQPVSSAGLRIREENGPDISNLAYFARIMAGKGFGLGTDAAGTAELDPLPPGALEIEIVRNNEVLARKTVRIRSGETQTLAIKLP